jgi:phenylacetate-CoA ligase
MNLVSKFLPEKILKSIREFDSKKWNLIRSKRMLELFHSAAKRVPAYGDFLKKNKIDPQSIRTLKDFQDVPVTNKNNYLRRYEMKDLCWDGTLDKALVFSATSGSTGKPFYFPHENELDQQYSVLTQLFLENARVERKPTLVIICFGMGVWIGGLFTYQAFQLASLREKNISLITPGINKDEILNALKTLSPNFSQTILVGYPPFIKDLVDDAILSGIALPRLNIRLLFAAESFTEVFRDHLAKATGIKNVFRDTLNIYGTADIGAMAFETPTSIMIRRMALEDSTRLNSLFDTSFKLPTLAQYNPYFTNFESPNGEVLLTGSNTMPLIRYAVGDKGGVKSFDEITSIKGLSEEDLRSAAKKYDLPLYNLPFVYVYERSDFAVKLYGATIYAEHIREALQSPLLLKNISGKFTMRVLTDERHDQYLELNVELSSEGKSSKHLEETIIKSVVQNLLAKNSEFTNNHTLLKDKVHPKIIFWTHGDPTHFKSGIKQKWVVKS